MPPTVVYTFVQQARQASVLTPVLLRAVVRAVDELCVEVNELDDAEQCKDYFPRLRRCKRDLAGVIEKAGRQSSPAIANALLVSLKKSYRALSNVVGRLSAASTSSSEEGGEEDDEEEGTKAESSSSGTTDTDDSSTSSSGGSGSSDCSRGMCGREEDPLRTAMRNSAGMWIRIMELVLLTVVVLSCVGVAFLEKNELTDRLSAVRKAVAHDMLSIAVDGLDLITEATGSRVIQERQSYCVAFLSSLMSIRVISRGGQNMMVDAMEPLWEIRAATQEMTATAHMTSVVTNRRYRNLCMTNRSVSTKMSIDTGRTVVLDWSLLTHGKCLDDLSNSDVLTSALVEGYQQWIPYLVNYRGQGAFAVQTLHRASQLSVIATVDLRTPQETHQLQTRPTASSVSLVQDGAYESVSATVWIVVTIFIGFAILVGLLELILWCAPFRKLSMVLALVTGVAVGVTSTVVYLIVREKNTESLRSHAISLLNICNRVVAGGLLSDTMVSISSANNFLDRVSVSSLKGRSFFVPLQNENGVSPSSMRDVAAYIKADVLKRSGVSWLGGSVGTSGSRPVLYSMLRIESLNLAVFTVDETQHAPVAGYGSIGVIVASSIVAAAVPLLFLRLTSLRYSMSEGCGSPLLLNLVTRTAFLRIILYASVMVLSVLLCILIGSLEVHLVQTAFTSIASRTLAALLSAVRSSNFTDLTDLNQEVPSFIRIFTLHVPLNPADAPATGVSPVEELAWWRWQKQQQGSMGGFLVYGDESTPLPIDLNGTYRWDLIVGAQLGLSSVHSVVTNVPSASTPLINITSSRVELPWISLAIVASAGMNDTTGLMAERNVESTHPSAFLFQAQSVAVSIAIVMSLMFIPLFELVYRRVQRAYLDGRTPRSLTPWWTLMAALVLIPAVTPLIFTAVSSVLVRDAILTFLDHDLSWYANVLKNCLESIPEAMDASYEGESNLSALASYVISQNHRRALSFYSRVAVASEQDVFLSKLAKIALLPTGDDGEELFLSVGQESAADVLAVAAKSTVWSGVTDVLRDVASPAVPHCVTLPSTLFELGPVVNEHGKPRTTRSCVMEYYTMSVPLDIVHPRKFLMTSRDEGVEVTGRANSILWMMLRVSGCVAAVLALTQWLVLWWVIHSAHRRGFASLEQESHPTLSPLQTIELEKLSSLPSVVPYSIRLAHTAYALIPLVVLVYFAVTAAYSSRNLKSALVSVIPGSSQEANLSYQITSITNLATAFFLTGMETPLQSLETLLNSARTSGNVVSMAAPYPSSYSFFQSQAKDRFTSALSDLYNLLNTTSQTIQHASDTILLAYNTNSYQSLFSMLYDPHIAVQDSIIESMSQVLNIFIAYTYDNSLSNSALMNGESLVESIWLVATLKDLLHKLFILDHIAVSTLVDFSTTPDDVGWLTLFSIASGTTASELRTTLLAHVSTLLSMVEGNITALGDELVNAIPDDTYKRTFVQSTLDSVGSQLNAAVAVLDSASLLWTAQRGRVEAGISNSSVASAYLASLNEARRQIIITSLEEDLVLRFEADGRMEHRLRKYLSGKVSLESFTPASDVQRMAVIHESQRNMLVALICAFSVLGASVMSAFAVSVMVVRGVIYDSSGPSRLVAERLSDDDSHGTSDATESDVKKDDDDDDDDADRVQRLIINEQASQHWWALGLAAATVLFAMVPMGIVYWILKIQIDVVGSNINQMSLIFSAVTYHGRISDLGRSVMTEASTNYGWQGDGSTARRLLLDLAVMVHRFIGAVFRLQRQTLHDYVVNANMSSSTELTSSSYQAEMQLLNAQNILDLLNEFHSYGDATTDALQAEMDLYDTSGSLDEAAFIMRLFEAAMDAVTKIYTSLDQLSPSSPTSIGSQMEISATATKADVRASLSTVPQTLAQQLQDFASNVPLWLAPAQVTLQMWHLFVAANRYGASNVTDLVSAYSNIEPLVGPEVTAAVYPAAVAAEVDGLFGELVTLLSPYPTAGVTLFTTSTTDPGGALVTLAQKINIAAVAATNQNSVLGSAKFRQLYAYNRRYLPESVYLVPGTSTPLVDILDDFLGNALGILVNSTALTGLREVGFLQLGEPDDQRVGVKIHPQHELLKNPQYATVAVQWSLISSFWAVFLGIMVLAHGMRLFQE